MPAHALPASPFSCAWTSTSLYRAATGPDPLLGPELTEMTDDLGGTRIEVDGWEEALRTAWAQVVGSEPSGRVGPRLPRGVRRPRAHRGLQRRLTRRRPSRARLRRAARDYFGVTYPAHLLHEHEDQVAAMRAAIVTVLDRHVRGAELDVPPFSEVYAAG